MHSYLLQKKNSLVKVLVSFSLNTDSQKIEMEMEKTYLL